MDGARSALAREIQALRSMAEGAGNKTIAYRLNMSRSPLKSQINSVFSKLGVASRTKAVMGGLRAGLVPL